MIKFDILTVSADGKKLIIGASVLDLPYYEKVYISKIFIDTQDTFEATRPSSEAWEKEIEGEQKTIFLELDNKELDLQGKPLPSIKDNLFFIYIECSGIPALDVPCGMDSKYTLGTAYNSCFINSQLMKYIKEISKSCKIPKGFINLFLRQKALEVSLCLKHYPEAIEFYKEFYKEPRLYRDSSLDINNLLDGFGLKDVKGNCGCNE